MIVSCELCGEDFLTESDCYVVRPTPKGNKLYCYCQIRNFEEMSAMEKLQAENAFLKENINGTKIKQMNDRIEDLLAENKKLREALELCRKEAMRPAYVISICKEVGEE
jgi:transcriptional regulator with PAS, ATPase and Fis domain